MNTSAMATGAASGATVGAVAGPYGAIIGGVAGGAMGAFSKKPADPNAPPKGNKMKKPKKLKRDKSMDGQPLPDSMVPPNQQDSKGIMGKLDNTYNSLFPPTDEKIFGVDKKLVMFAGIGIGAYFIITSMHSSNKRTTRTRK